jgi:hypothetical protein
MHKGRFWCHVKKDLVSWDELMRAHTERENNWLIFETGLRARVRERLDFLQKMLENNDHINNQREALEMVSSISKFWSVLSEEDRDYIQTAQHAIDEQQTWNI